MSHLVDAKLGGASESVFDTSQYTIHVVLVAFKLKNDRIPHPEETELLIACETSLEQIFTHIKNTAPDLVIIDSIQTISTENIESSPGSIVQVRECSASILKFAKETGTPVILIGHINKEGSILLVSKTQNRLQYEG